MNIKGVVQDEKKVSAFFFPPEKNFHVPPLAGIVMYVVLQFSTIHLDGDELQNWTKAIN